MQSTPKRALFVAAKSSDTEFGTLVASAIRGQNIDPETLREVLLEKGYVLEFEDRRNNQGFAVAIKLDGDIVAQARDENRNEAVLAAVAGKLKEEIGQEAWAELLTPPATNVSKPDVLTE